MQKTEQFIVKCSKECPLTSQSSTVQIESLSNFGSLLTSFPYNILLLTSICCSLSLELYAAIIYYIFDVLHVSIATKWYVAVQFYFVIKFSLLNVVFEF